MATKNSFTFIGKIVPIKDTDSFKGYTEMVYDSKWMSQKLRFNVVAGDNRHLVEINAGRWQDEKKNSVVYTYSKAADGKQSEPIQIPWDKRNDPTEIAKVAGYRVFTVDTDTYSNRKALKDAEDVEGLAASEKKRKHFLAGTDFIDWTRKVVNSDKIKDMMFKVQGSIEYSYNEKTGKYYSTYEVNKIYRAEDDAEPKSEMNVHFYFTENFMDKESVADAGKAVLSGYTQFRDSKTKADWFCPIALVMRESDMEIVEGTEEILSDFGDNEVCKAVLSCKVIDGAQKTDIQVTDLDEKTQKAIKLGLMNEKQAIKNAGGQAYGPKIQEFRLDSIVKQSEPTVFTEEDLTVAPYMKEEEVNIFNDSDDEDDI